MKLPDFTVERLKQLPLRAIVAFGARCARRVQALAELPADHPERETLRRAVETSIMMAERVASGRCDSPEKSEVEAIGLIRKIQWSTSRAEKAAIAAADAASAAVSVCADIGTHQLEKGTDLELPMPGTQHFLGAVERATAEDAALASFMTAAQAFASIGIENEAFVNAALHDFDTLVRLNLGHFPELGNPIDATPDGPLGHL